jgi:hypothetical protein
VYDSVIGGMKKGSDEPPLVRVNVLGIGTSHRVSDEYLTGPIRIGNSYKGNTRREVKDLDPRSGESVNEEASESERYFPPLPARSAYRHAARCP